MSVDGLFRGFSLFLLILQSLFFSTISTLNPQMLTSQQSHQNHNVGIVAMDIYIPKKFVDQQQLETFDGVSAGKYTIGLGQLKMAVVDDREDINSMCLTVVQNLLEKYNISPDQIGRLEVGTETIIDKSKSVKSVLMQLFGDNTDIEGVDTTNACYGGTNALFNCINWLESSSYDGRYAIAVAADIAVYKSGSARPTGGAGAVAMLLGRDAPLVFDVGVRSTHVEHVYDFYKPDLHSEYPEVDGPLSNKCYTRAVDVCYNRYLNKLSKLGVESPTIENFDYMTFHSPYGKLVQKSFGRLLYNDFLRTTDTAKFGESLEKLRSVSLEESYTNRDIEKGFMAFSKEAFNSKVGPATMASKNLGNMYCASLYGALASLLSNVDADVLLNKRIGLFSYGSGLASSMFSITVRGDTSEIKSKLNVQERLNSRTCIEPSAYDEVMLLREKTHNCKDYQPTGQVDEQSLFKGTFYLEGVDSKFRRTYARYV
ncbi:hydroxymethylglutaryl-CoA synthase [Globomyces pollinis-pini]|nr:hydroxymethylglutaryl-CoA synthase [Globomyces pollinis-pini]